MLTSLICFNGVDSGWVPERGYRSRWQLLERNSKALKPGYRRTAQSTEKGDVFYREQVSYPHSYIPDGPGHGVGQSCLVSFW